MKLGGESYAVKIIFQSNFDLIFGILTPDLQSVPQEAFLPPCSNF